MSEINLPSNSHKSKEIVTQNSLNKKTKAEKVTHGRIETRKPGLTKRLVRIFVAEDIPDIKTFLITDVLIPAIRDTFVDLMENGARMIAYGSTAGSHRKNKNNPQTTYTYYNGYFQSSNKQQNKPQQNAVVSKDFDEIVFSEKGDAELVLDQMLEILSTYNQVSVNDLYDLIGKTGDFTDANWGWTNLSSACTKRVSGGYIISFPRVQQL